MMAIHLSWCTPVDKRKLSVREITLFPILAAMTFAAKWVMAFLPNIEPVTLMVLLFGAVFGWKAIFPVAVYVAAEILFYGLGVWNFYYLYIWFVPMVMGIILRRMENPLGWAIAAGFFGLAFGALCAIANMFIGGFGYGIAWWISGIEFDLLHCAGNFVIVLVAFKPLRQLMEKLYQK